jgi:thiamine pyrophosphokinase
MERTCIIVANGEFNKTNINKKDGDLLIVADSENYKLLNFDDIDIFIGDFDSLDEIPKGKDFIKLPIEKNDTDTMYAIKYGIQKGYKNFALYGVLGKRFDHTFANIQSLNFIKEEGFTGVIYDSLAKVCYRILKNESISFDKKQTGIFSAFSLSDEATISIVGLKYPLDHKKITNSYPLCISNEFVGNDSKITVYSGSVLIIYKY